jgi:hypothetical protein
VLNSEICVASRFADIVAVMEGSSPPTVYARAWGIAGVLDRGMFSKGSPVNPGELATSLEEGAKVPRGRSRSRFASQVGRARRSEISPHQGQPTPREDRRRRSWVTQQSYEPILPMKVENPRAPARGGQGIHWREGGNRWTV